MRNLDKYKGVIPAFYACYDENGEISPEKVRELTKYHIKKGVKGVYVNGSSENVFTKVLKIKKLFLKM